MLPTGNTPTARDVRIFAGLWPAFLLAVGGVAWWRPEGLLAAAAVLSVAWLVGALANPGDPRRFAGVLLPAAFAAAGGAAVAGGDRRVIVGACAALGLAGAIAILAAPGFGRRLYTGWMAAAEPIGWTISTVVLAVVYYAVFTPIGVGMRVLGRDPLDRKIDGSATSYWVRRRPATDRARYFRQF